MSDMQSLYKKLDVERFEIRVLEIHSDPPGSVVRCSLKPKPLDSPSNYTALSYCWGDPTITTNIVINGILVPVTVNLEKALQQLRQNGVAHVWADAICINQKDDHEKSVQVRMMKQVYSKAAYTYAWVSGREDHTLARAVAFLRSVSKNPHVLETSEHCSHQISSSPQSWRSNRKTQARTSFTLASASNSGREEHESQCQRCILASNFQALVRLFNQPYWTRRWIIQEVTVSPRVEFICGTESCSVNVLRTALNHCRATIHWNPEHDVASRHFDRVLQARELFRRGDSMLSLCHILFHTQDFQSQDARDIAYALIGFCHDGEELIPMPNYFLSPELVARDISRALLRKNRCMDIIVEGIRDTNTPSALPTWSPHWLSSTMPRDLHMVANAKPRLDFDFGANVLRGERDMLFVKGTIVGSICQVSTSSSLVLTPADRLSSVPPGVTQHDPHDYYKKPSAIRAAISSCLLAPHGQPGEVDTRAPYSSIRFHHLLQCLKGRGWCVNSVMLIIVNYVFTARFKELRQGIQAGRQSYLAAYSVYELWLRNNAMIPIGDKSLSTWLSEGLFSNYLHQILATRTFTALAYAPALSSIVVLVLIIIIYFPEGKKWWFYLCLALTFVLAAALGIWVTATSRIATKDRSATKRQMIAASETISEKQLIVSDQGLLGMAGLNVQPGDKICLLAGCRSGVVLRERQSQTPSQKQYEVVGKVYLCFNREDARKYEAFMPISPDDIRLKYRTLSTDRSKNKKLKASLKAGDVDVVYRHFIKQCEQQSWWQEFELV